MRRSLGVAMWHFAPWRPAGMYHSRICAQTLASRSCVVAVCSTSVSVRSLSWRFGNALPKAAAADIRSRKGADERKAAGVVVAMDAWRVCLALASQGMSRTSLTYFAGFSAT